MIKGDRVIYTGDSRGLKATVIDTSYSLYYPSLLINIEFDDANLIPRRMEVAPEYVKLLLFCNAADPNCICGLKFCRDGGKHSDYCEVKND